MRDDRARWPMSPRSVVAPMGRLTQIWLAIISMLLAQEIVTVLMLAQDLTPQRPTIGLDATTITLIGGMVVTIIGTLVTGAVTIITALRVSAVSTAQAVATTQINTVAKDTEAIKGHVNSEKTAGEGRETALRKENALLREMMAKQEATAALLAQATVATAAARAHSATGDVPRMAPIIGIQQAAPIIEKLENIDSNTKAIEENTAKTEAAVREIKDQA